MSRSSAAKADWWSAQCYCHQSETWSVEQDGGQEEHRGWLGYTDTCIHVHEGIFLENREKPAAMIVHDQSHTCICKLKQENK